MSYDIPEDRLKREKEYQPDGPAQGQNQGQGGQPDENYGVAEKQGRGGQPSYPPQPNNQQYDQSVVLRTEIFDPQYGQPNNQQYGQPNNQQYGQSNDQQYGQPNNPQYTGGQPNDQPIRTEIFDPQYGQPINQQYSGGQPINQQYGQPINQQYDHSINLRTEIFDGMDEKSGPGQGGNPAPYAPQQNGQNQWMDEKRGVQHIQQGGNQQYTGGQPINQQYDQPIRTEIFDPQYGQPINQQYGQSNDQQYDQPIKTEMFDPQYGQPNGQPNNPQYGQANDQPVNFKTEVFDQQYGQPNNQPTNFKTEVFDPKYGQPNNQQYGQSNDQPIRTEIFDPKYGQPNSQPLNFKTEIFDGMDEKGGPGQGGNPAPYAPQQNGEPINLRTEIFDQQYGQPSGQHTMQHDWTAELRAQRSGQQTGNQQYGQQSGQVDQSRQWMAEKRGPVQGGVTPPQANQYRQPRQGAPAVGPGQDPNQWMREKQGLPPQAAANQAAWHQEKNFKPAKSNRNLYFILGGVGAVVLIAIVVVVFLLIQPKTPPVPAATATAPVTTAAATTVAVTTAPVTTAPVTTAPVTTAPAKTTAAPATTAPAKTTAAPATTSAASDSAKLLTLAQDAANGNKWQDVVNALEPLSPSDPNYSKAKPLLVKAYVNLGEQAVADKSNSQESANLALTNFRKANSLDATFSGLATELQKADSFATGLLQFNSEQFQQAVNTIKPLYDSSATQVDGVHYRNTADILYNSYLKLGDKVFNAGNVDALTQARNFYSLALAVDIDNRDEANKKLLQVTNALKLLGVTQTPKK